MKLDELILEKRTPLKKQKYKASVDEVSAWKLIHRHCKDALPHLATPLVRGMRMTGERSYLTLHGAAGFRTSANTSNHYTVILDHVLSPLGFPKRSASMICANWPNRKHAGGYGVQFAIIPYDGVKIGVCPHYDMWETEIKIGGWSREIHRWNRELKYMGVDEHDTYEKMVETLELKAETMEEQGWKHSDETWMKAFLPGKADKTLKEAYSKPFKLTTTKEAIYNDGKKHEVWIGGKCVAIELEMFFNMLEVPMTEADLYGWDED